MRRYLRIYKECMRVAWNQAAAYRVNFLLTTLITLFGNILFPLVTILIYQTGSSFPGWNFYEVLLLQSIFTMSDGVAGIITGGVLWTTLQHVKEGSLDTVLLKPVNPLFFLVSSTLEPENIGLVVGGGILFGVSITHLGDISVLSFLGGLGLFLSGVAVLAGMAFLMAATSFKWVGNSRIPEIFDSVKSFGKYPITIFPKAVQSLVTCVIPVAVIAYFPAKVILQKGVVGGVSTYLVCIPCVLFFFVSIWLFGFMIRLYEGVGG